MGGASHQPREIVDSQLNVLITGPTGIGKSFLAATLAHQACRQDIGTRYYRLPLLAEELSRAAAQHKKSAFFKQLARVKLLVLDDFGLTPIADETKLDLLEIMDFDCIASWYLKPFMAVLTRE